MPGTRAGGLKAAETNKKRYPDFYKTLGRMGGTKSRGGGFAYNRELAAEAGRKGGTTSRRKSPKPSPAKSEEAKGKIWGRLFQKDRLKGGQ